MLIGDILRRNARRYPRKTALVCGEIRYSFADFNARVNRLTNALLDMGMRKGDKVAVLLDNSHQFVEVFCAVPKGGLVFVLLGTRLTNRELIYNINNAEANTLLFGENYSGVIDSIRGELRGIRNFIIVGTPRAEIKGYEQLISYYPPDEPNVDLREEDIAYLYYTGGTTGLPKGVPRTHRIMLEEAIDIVLTQRITHSDIIFLVPGFPANPLPLFYLGGGVVITNEFVPQSVLESIEKEKVTYIPLAPSQIMRLLDYPDINKYDLSSLRLIVYAGESMAVVMLKRAVSTFGNVIAQMYGLTEASTITFLSPDEIVLEGPPEKLRRLSSCGREATNSEIRIVDEQGRDVPPGEVGEIITKSDHVMRGYWELPQATAETLKGSYLYTGDLATRDDEGYIYLIGRKKDTIISGGKAVYPTEVEEVLYRHPSISEAAVIGIPDEKMGELVKAVVVLKGKATEAEIIEFCRRNLVTHAVPLSVAFVDTLPRNQRGKVLRTLLRERHQSK